MRSMRSSGAAYLALKRTAHARGIRPVRSERHAGFTKYDAVVKDLFQKDHPSLTS